MASIDETRLLLLGPPGSGKSTFLAALWHELTSEELRTALQLTHVEGNHQYLDELTEAWRRCIRVDRNKVGDFEPITLHLSDGDSSFAVSIPDISGEELTQACEDRAWPPLVADLVRSAGGVMLFVRPRTMNEPETLDDTIQNQEIIDQAAGRAAEDALSDHPLPGGISDPHEPDAEAMEEPFHGSLMPTQSLLVDALQEIAFTQQSTPATTLVISAWDTVKSTRSARMWLRNRLPLLFQYLEANRVSYEVVGISAQGGRLPNEAQALLAHDRPSDRIRVLRGRSSTHDLTEVLRSLWSRGQSG